MTAASFFRQEGVRKTAGLPDGGPAVRRRGCVGGGADQMLPKKSRNSLTFDIMFFEPV